MYKKLLVVISAFVIILLGLAYKGYTTVLIDDRLLIHSNISQRDWAIADVESYTFQNGTVDVVYIDGSRVAFQPNEAKWSAEADQTQNVSRNR